jgi:hypothetical protein
MTGKRVAGKELDMLFQTRHLPPRMDTLADPGLYTISDHLIVQYIESQYNKRLLFSIYFLSVVLGLRRAATPAVLTLTLNLFVVFWSALRSYPPAFPPKLDGSGILLLSQIL